MASYKLTYFDLRGKGELCRYVFYAAGKDFEDARIERETWPQVKPTTPFGQVPVLKANDKVLAQSNAIARYLAREFDLAGKTSWEQALADQYIELTAEINNERGKAMREADAEKREELKKNLFDVILPKYLDILEKSLVENGGSYFVGDALTVADLAVYQSCDTPLLLKPTLLDAFPKLKAHRGRVEAVPTLGEYIKNRKQTEI